MVGLSYETLEVLVYDPVAANRNSTRAALVALGVRQVDCVSAPVDFAYSNYRRNPDIIFCEISSEDLLMCDQIQAVRAGTVGNNPFVVIVATAWEKSAPLIQRIINAGADDVLLRPFSSGILAMRIEALAEHRKGFVITHDYVGPDRRRDPKRVSSGLFEPPNSLKLKAADHLAPQAVSRLLPRELETAKAFLFNEKMRVDVFQVGVLCRLLQGEAVGSESFVRHLERMSHLARTILERGTEAKISGVDMWCKEVLSAADSLEKESEREEAFRFLDRASANLYQIVNPIKTVEEYQSSMKSALAAIRARIAEGLAV